MAEQLVLEAFVGAGSAGSVIASRLTENPNYKVLLLEAGGDENSISETPAFTLFLQQTDLNWKYKNEQVPGACLGLKEKVHFHDHSLKWIHHKLTNYLCLFSFQSCLLPRGKVLGGSSTINYLLYVRGNKRDFDGWANLGNYGWSYEEVLPYFKKSEDNENPVYARNERYHSTNGNLTISDIKFKTPLSDIFLRAGQEFGYRIGDYNAENQTAFAPLQIFARNGTRCSTSKAFLHPTIGRKNLDIAKFAHILIDAESKRAYGVRFFRNGKYHDVYARKEVILSAGAANTPQLLMLSGIGPKNELKKLGIPLIKDLPVGFNLQDHYALPLVFLTDKPITYTPSRYNTILTNMSYDIYRSGPLSVPFGIEATGFISTKYQDPKLDFPDIQLFLVSASAATDAGKFTLKLVEESKAFKEVNAKYHFVPIPMCPNAVPPSDEYLDCYMRWYTTVEHHLSGTAKMGPHDDPTAVVDPELRYHFLLILLKFNLNFRVYGISGLRVADASIMPIVTTGNTNAPVIMIGEKASDLIKNSWKNA
ncbi:Glucose dehydrogenase [FAD, quinone] [Armadillidium nasatum]|uniref:Glucose dehydrogenase [FAD, quinone] n=1 Tax=Armadillidium nasatum TaxID=96803 RepID=A0A5N5SP71_9CRUS|nr:Glucose dehydrogenase [FAD, quinone] [Armadillidium nasatum]